jgi:arylsulfatase A-like enzyme
MSLVMKRRPNILLLMADQLRADWVGPGNRGGAVTPAIDRLIARGSWFRNAICPSPLCAPSRACFATGKEYRRCGVLDDSASLAGDAATIYKRLRNAGYSVLTCGKLDLLKGENDWGRDGRHMRGDGSALLALGFTGGLASAGKHAAVAAYHKGKPEPYGAFLEACGLAEVHVADFATRKSPSLGETELGEHAVGAHYENTEPTPLPDHAYGDNWVAGEGLRLISEARATEAPWFLQVNFVGPHEPMDITRRMAADAATRDPHIPAELGSLPPERHLAIRRNYTSIVENIDRIVARYVDYLDQVDLLESTLIILASDHGEMLGDHGIWEKSVPYQQSLRVPLIIAGPGVVPGLAHDGPATTLDLHATILDHAGIGLPSDIDSRSLAPVLAGRDKKGRQYVFSGLGAWRAVYDGRLKLLAGYRAGARIDPRSRGSSFDLEDSSTWRLIDTELDPAETGSPLDVDRGSVGALAGALVDNERGR